MRVMALKTDLEDRPAARKSSTSRLVLSFVTCLVLSLALGACSDDPQEPPATANNDGNNDDGNNDDGNNDTPPLTGELGLQVGNGDARACEVMLKDPGKALGELRADDSIEGRALRRGDMLAVAFAQTGDVAVESGAVRFALSGTADGVEIESVTCFDRSGNPLSEPAVELLSEP